MSSPTYQIAFPGTAADVPQIQAWMIAENRETKGYQHDISVLQAHLSDGTFAVMRIEEKAVGFVTWSKGKRVACIEHAAIQPAYRGVNLGQTLVNILEDHLREQGILVFYLRSASPGSNRFWRKTGFKKMADLPGYAGNFFYKVINSQQSPGRSVKNSIRMHPWGSQKATNWPLNFQQVGHELIQPIIAPAAGDWCITRTTNGVVGNTEKIKNFCSGNCFEGPSLIITSC